MKIDEFITKIPKWSKEGLISASPNYLDALKVLESKELYNIQYILNKFDQLKIMGFGYRNFWPDGTTSIYSLSKDWHNLIKKAGFIDLNRAYISSELVLAVKNKINVSTRTGDKIDNKYLTILNRTSVNNGIFIYNYSCTRIEIFFFNCSNPKDRDLLLNQISSIQNLINSSKRIFRKIIDSREMLVDRIPILNAEQIKICFQQKINQQQNSKFLNVIVDGKTLIFSHCDLECMYFLQYGSSLKYIADRLKKSPASIKDRVESLKHKLNVYTKDDLIKIARQDLSFLLADYYQSNASLINN